MSCEIPGGYLGVVALPPGGRPDAATPRSYRSGVSIFFIVVESAMAVVSYVSA